MQLLIQCRVLALIITHSLALATYAQYQAQTAMNFTPVNKVLIAGIDDTVEVDFDRLLEQQNIFRNNMSVQPQTVDWAKVTVQPPIFKTSQLTLPSQKQNSTIVVQRSIDGTNIELFITSLDELIIVTLQESSITVNRTYNLPLRSLNISACKDIIVMKELVIVDCETIVYNKTSKTIEIAMAFLPLHYASENTHYSLVKEPSIKDMYVQILASANKLLLNCAQRNSYIYSQGFYTHLHFCPYSRRGSQDESLSKFIDVNYLFYDVTKQDQQVNKWKFEKRGSITGEGSQKIIPALFNVQTVHFMQQNQQLILLMQPGRLYYMNASKLDFKLIGTNSFLNSHQNFNINSTVFFIWTNPENAREQHVMAFLDQQQLFMVDVTLQQQPHYLLHIKLLARASMAQFVLTTHFLIALDSRSLYTYRLNAKKFTIHTQIDFNDPNQPPQLAYYDRQRLQDVIIIYQNLKVTFYQVQYQLASIQIRTLIEDSTQPTRLLPFTIRAQNYPDFTFLLPITVIFQQKQSLVINSQFPNGFSVSEMFSDISLKSIAYSPQLVVSIYSAYLIESNLIPSKALAKEQPQKTTIVYQDASQYFQIKRHYSKPLVISAKEEYKIVLDSEIEAPDIESLKSTQQLRVLLITYDPLSKNVEKIALAVCKSADFSNYSAHDSCDDWEDIPLPENTLVITGILVQKQQAVLLMQQRSKFFLANFNLGTLTPLNIPPQTHFRTLKRLTANIFAAITDQSQGLYFYSLNSNYVQQELVPTKLIGRLEFSNGLLIREADFTHLVESGSLYVQDSLHRIIKFRYYIDRENQYQFVPIWSFSIGVNCTFVALREIGYLATLCPNENIIQLYYKSKKLHKINLFEHHIVLDIPFKIPSVQTHPPGILFITVAYFSQVTLKIERKILIVDPLEQQLSAILFSLQDNQFCTVVRNSILTDTKITFITQKLQDMTKIFVDTLLRHPLLSISLTSTNLTARGAAFKLQLFVTSAQLSPSDSAFIEIEVYITSPTSLVPFKFNYSQIVDFSEKVSAQQPLELPLQMNNFSGPVDQVEVISGHRQGYFDFSIEPLVDSQEFLSGTLSYTDSLQYGYLITSQLLPWRNKQGDDISLLLLFFQLKIVIVDAQFLRNELLTIKNPYDSTFFAEHNTCLTFNFLCRTVFFVYCYQSQEISEEYKNQIFRYDLNLSDIKNITYKQTQIKIDFPIGNFLLVRSIAPSSDAICKQQNAGSVKAPFQTYEDFLSISALDVKLSERFIYFIQIPYINTEEQTLLPLQDVSANYFQTLDFDCRTISIKEQNQEKLIYFIVLIETYYLQIFTFDPLTKTEIQSASYSQQDGNISIQSLGFLSIDIRQIDYLNNSYKVQLYAQNQSALILRELYLNFDRSEITTINTLSLSNYNPCTFYLIDTYYVKLPNDEELVARTCFSAKFNSYYMLLHKVFVNKQLSFLKLPPAYYTDTLLYSIKTEQHDQKIYLLLACYGEKYRVYNVKSDYELLISSNTVFNKQSLAVCLELTALNTQRAANMSVDLFLINKNYVEYEKPFLLSQLILLAFILSILMIFLFSAAARQQRLSANSEIHRISEQFDDLKNQIDTLSMSNNVSQIYSAPLTSQKSYKKQLKDGFSKQDSLFEEDQDSLQQSLLETPMNIEQLNRAPSINSNSEDGAALSSCSIKNMRLQHKKNHTEETKNH